MALQISNKRVVEFYKRHSMVSFEEVNVFMVDILEKMRREFLEMESVLSVKGFGKKSITIICGFKI
mgnify:CR=1 FL=1